MIVTHNRKYAFFIGIMMAIGGWYALMLMTQPNEIKITRDQYIGLGFAIITYILWWLKFCYTVKV